MEKKLKQTTEMNTLTGKCKSNSWFSNSTLILLLLMSTLMWQCEKDTFEDETTSLCPKVIATDPTNGATNVVTNKIITATFNEAVVPATISAETFTVKQGNVPVSGIVTYAGLVATFTPLKTLEANKAYTGTITKKVKDPAGNYMLADYIWSFTTGNVPTVISTDPANASSKVPLNKVITATFSTAMNPSTINGSSFLINQGTNKIAGTVSYSGTTATFIPTSPLIDNTVYNGTITMAATDVAGNAMASDYKWSFSTAQTQYTITLLSNPVEGGSTSGGGLFNKDAQTTVVAVPVTGYTFTNWTEGTTIVSTNTNYAVTATSNRTLVANFSINTYTLNITAANGSVVKVPNQTTYNYGSLVQLTATPNTGYSFTGWSGDATGTSNSSTIVMNSNKSVTANFVLTPPNTYTLNVSSTLGGTAAKNPNAASYTNGTVVQVTASPNAGYSFSGWSGDATGTTNPLSVTMSADKDIIANFTIIPIVTYSLNVTANNGVVVKNPNQANYTAGSTVQLTATPNTGYTFSGWSGDATGSTNPLTVTMNSSKNITANFTLIPPTTYTLNVTAVNGTVLKNPNQTNYDDGTTVQLTAKPNAGYSFAGWSGDVTGASNSVTILMNSNKNITANFVVIPPNTYVLNVSSTLGGTTAKNPNTISYSSGTIVQVTATPNTGYTFAGWSGDATGITNPLSVTMSADKDIIANFTIIPIVTYSLNVTANNGVVVKNPNQANYTAGSTVQLTATPNTGYTFSGWSGDATGSTNPLTVTMNSNKNITANFTLIPPTTYTLNVTAVNGTVLKNPNQTNYDNGTTVQLTATPNAGYSFAGWSGDVTGVSNSVTILMNSNKNITANFVVIPPNTYVLNVSSTLGGTTAKNPNAISYSSGTIVQVTATPNAGYTFSGWSGDATGITNPLSVTMSEDKDIIANFTIIPIVTYSINVTANNGVVVKNPNQANYTAGSTVQLTATPNTGYTFSGWSGDATGSTNPLTVTMNSNKNITANFTLIPPTTYTLNVSAINGTVVKNPNTATYNSGSTVQLTATPNTGYTFTGWSGDATGTTNPLTVAMNANKNITANFTAIPPTTYTLNVTAVNGTVLKNPNTATYTNGSTVQLTATPSVGYTFTSWGGDATGSVNPLTVTMNSNKNITANFTLIPPTTYTLNVTAINGSVVKNPNTATYNSGATVQLTATPNSGYTFSSWGGDATGTTNPLTVTMNNNKDITANFSIITFTLNVISNNGSVVKNPVKTNYDYGENVELTATPNSGYTFDSWSGDATGSTNPITVLMDANKTVTANYTVLPPSGPAGVDLGSAGDFAILAGAGISNTGVTTMINGDVGSFPTATIAGLLPGNVVGTLYTTADPIVGLAKADLTTAYNDAQSRSLDAISLPGQIGGLTLAPGLYVNSTTSGISGTGPQGILTLDAGGNPNAVWIFKVGSTFITDAGTSIVLAGDAQAKNIYWSVGTSATLGTNSTFYGNILADQAITLTTGATLYGRALTRVAAVVLDSNTVTKP